MAGSFEPAKTGDSTVDRNFRELAQLLNAVTLPAPYQAAAVTRDYQATGFEGTIHVDASRGPVRVTLPKPSVFMPPLIVRQVNLTGKHGGVTVAATAGKKTIAGASTYSLDDSGTGSATFTSDGTQHWPSAAAGGNPPVNPVAPPPPPFTPPPTTQFVPLTRAINTAAPLTGGGALSADLTLSLNTDGTLEVSGGVLTIAPHAVDYGRMQQEGAATLLGNPTGSLADVQEIPLGTGLAFMGGALVNTAPLPSLVPGEVVYGASGGGIGQSSDLFFDASTGHLGIGTSVPGYRLDILQSLPGVVGFRVQNTDPGSSSQVQNLLANDVGSLAYYGIASSTFSAFLPIDFGKAFFGGFQTDVSIFTQTANDIIFYPNAAESGRWTAGGAFQLVSLGAGGMVKAVNPTGALSIATAADYVPPGRLINTTLPLTGGGDLSADLTLDINVFGASGGSHSTGAVPDPGGSAGATRFLREDATWVTVSADHKLLVDGSDTSPDYLDAKLAVTVPLTKSVVSAGPPTTNLLAWFKADAGVTLSGSNVATWADQSGNGNDVSAVGAAQPAFTTGVVNGLPGVTFSSGNVLTNTLTSLVTAGSPRYVAAIVKVNSTGGAIMSNRTTPAYFAALLFNAGFTYVYSDGATVNTNINSPPSIAGTAFVYELGSTGTGAGTITAFLDGTSYALTTPNAATEAGTTGFMVGSNAAGQFFDGSIVELFFYSAPPSPTDLGQLRGYMQGRSAIPVSGAGGGGEILTLAALYDGTTITLNGSNQLQVGSIASAQVNGNAGAVAFFNAIGELDGNASTFTWNDGASLLTVDHVTISGGASSALSFTQATTQNISKSNGALGILTVGADAINFATTNTVRMTIEAGGAVDVVSLNAGGLVNAASSTGQLGLATVGPALNYSGSTLRLGSVAGPAAPAIAEFANVPPNAVAAANMQAAYLWDQVTITLTGSTHVTGNGLALASFAGPTITDASAVTVDAASTLLVTGPPTAAGSVTLTRPISLWVAAGRTRLDGALTVNAGASIFAASDSFVVAPSVETDRDRMRFFVGGGTLGPTGTGDSTLVDVIPSGTSIKAGVTGGIYATERIRSLTYTGVSSPTISEAASLYIDGAPTISGASGSAWALHIKSGPTFIEDVFEVVTANCHFVVPNSVVGGYVDLGDFGMAGGNSTSATTHFLYVSTCAGTPTGTPNATSLGFRSGSVPMVYDNTNDHLYIWNTITNAWKLH